MHVYVLDLAFLMVAAGVAWAVARGGLVHAAAIWFTFLLAALIALNCFEPVATFVSDNMFAATDTVVTRFLWFAALIVIFCGVTVFSLIGVFKVFPDATGLTLGPEVKGKSAWIRWCFSLLAGYTLAAFLLTSLHAFPSTRDFGGVFPPERALRAGPIMSLGPDYQLLTLTEYTCLPRSPVTGIPWQPDGPLVETKMQGNRWASFPNRYAIWREGINILVYGEDVPFGSDDEGVEMRDYDAIDDRSPGGAGDAIDLGQEPVSNADSVDSSGVAGEQEDAAVQVESA